MRTMPGPKRASVALFLLVGIAMLGGSALLTAKARRLERTGIRVSGKVIRLDYTRGTFYPVVEFVTQGGQQVRFRGRSGSNPATFYPGETVTVLHEPDNPWNAVIESFGELWLGPWITGVMGIAFSGVAIGVLLGLGQSRVADPFIGFDHIVQK
jgi:hypothetical protein